MTKEFRRMVELLQTGVFGTTSENITEANPEAVCELALKQGVLPLVYGALSKEQRKALNPRWEQMFFRAMMKNEQKMSVLSGIIKKLDDEGIPCCILKGWTVAKDYHLSECRLSGDIDLYVDPKDEQRTMKFFEKLGFDVEPRPEGKHDFKANSPATGLIEVHVQLYMDLFSREVLKGKFGITEDFCEMKITEYLTVKSLGINDTLDFLTAHFIKHFVREGSGIRQITDLLAFVEKNKDEIDFKAYFEQLDEIRFKDTILNVFGIGVKYFNLDLEYYRTEGVEELMDDVEMGENFGFGETERRLFYEHFLMKHNCRDAGAQKRVAREKKITVYKSVFLPGRKLLEKKGYKYLEKSALLYPVAYVHRLFDLLRRMMMGKSKYKSAISYAETENNIIKKRIEMMKKLNIVD